jgi:hypothetical protein
MSVRYSKSEVASIVQQIETEAKEAGLIPADSVLVYRNGNTSYVSSATVICFSSDGERYREADSFIPEFNGKMGPTEQYRLLEATLRVFHSFRKQRQEADKRKMAYLSAHVARRSE